MIMMIMMMTMVLTVVIEMMRTRIVQCRELFAVTSAVLLFSLVSTFGLPSVCRNYQVTLPWEETFEGLLLSNNLQTGS